MMHKLIMISFFLFANANSLQPNLIVGKWKVVDFLAKSNRKANASIALLMGTESFPETFIFTDKQVSSLNKKGQTLSEGIYHFKGGHIIITQAVEEIIYSYSLKPTHDTLLLSTDDFTCILKKEK